jgi:FkbM family methyltransferase
VFLTNLRKPVDTYAPWLAHSYRTVRDLTTWRLSRQTEYGFQLAGDAQIARSDFETGEAQTFLRQCENHDMVFDIGANVGFYSCLAASRGKRVLAFEPAPRNLKFLYRNLLSNGFSAVEVFPVGLGPKAGLMPIYGYGGITSFIPGWAQSPKNGSHFAPVATLDFLVDGKFADQRVLIKMDVEGFELDVLTGARRTLNRNPKPTWMVEVLLASSVLPGGISQKFARTFEEFWSCGYRCTALGLKETDVTVADVERWIRDGAVEGDVHNFLFFAK